VGGELGGEVEAIGAEVVVYCRRVDGGLGGGGVDGVMEAGRRDEEGGGGYRENGAGVRRVALRDGWL